MRFALCILLLFLLPFACSVKTDDPLLEQTAQSGKQGYMEATVYRAGEEGAPIPEQKLLPIQSDMESYVLSFVIDDPAVQYNVQLSRGLASVDVKSFPNYEIAAAEASAVAGIVNTALACHGVESVRLTFDGKALKTLPMGTEIDEVYAAPF